MRQLGCHNREADLTYFQPQIRWPASSAVCMSQTPEVPGNAQGNEGVAPNATEGVDPLTSAPSAPAATASEGSGPLDTSVTAIQQKPPDEPTPSASATLQQQIKSLTALQGRVAKLRGLPAQLLAFHLHPQSSGLTLDMGVSTLGVDTIDSLLSSTVGVPLTKSQAAGVQSRNAFRALTDTRTELLSEASQKALKVARESEASDKSDILAHGRRERKRRYVCKSPHILPAGVELLSQGGPPPPNHLRLSPLSRRTPQTSSLARRRTRSCSLRTNFSATYATTTRARRMASQRSTSGRNRDGRRVVHGGMWIPSRSA